MLLGWVGAVLDVFSTPLGTVFGGVIVGIGVGGRGIAIEARMVVGSVFAEDGGLTVEFECSAGKLNVLADLPAQALGFVVIEKVAVELFGDLLGGGAGKGKSRGRAFGFGGVRGDMGVRGVLDSLASPYAAAGLTASFGELFESLFTFCDRDRFCFVQGKMSQR